MELFTEDHIFQRWDREKRVWVPKTRLPKTLCVPQLRLFAVELTFLTLVLSKYKNIDNCVVVYAGAATGNHIPSLAFLFPRIVFYLYDPHKFDIKPTSQIYIMKEKFTDERARQWGESAKTVIFISDIRSSGYFGPEYEKSIGSDMLIQARWVEIMKPAWSCLEFRIPYPVMERGEMFSYLGGWLIKEPFAKALSTRMRLIGNQEHAKKGARDFMYDSKSLEQLMFHHNTVTRIKRDLYYNVYTLDQKKYDDLIFDNGYDFTYLLFVVDKYLMSPHAITVKHSIGEADNIAFVKSLVRSYVKELPL